MSMTFPTKVYGAQQCTKELFLLVFLGNEWHKTFALIIHVPHRTTRTCQLSRLENEFVKALLFILTKSRKLMFGHTSISFFGLLGERKALLLRLLHSQCISLCSLLFSQSFSPFFNYCKRSLR